MIQLPQAKIPSVILALYLMPGCTLIEDEVTPGLDAGGANCPPALTEASVDCTSSDCQSTTGTKTHGIAQLSNETSQNWTIVSWAVSEISDADANTNVSYVKGVSNGLLSQPTARVRTPIRDPLVYTPQRLARLAFDNELWSRRPQNRPNLAALHGTAIRGRTLDLLPEDTDKQSTSCDELTPKSCGSTMICVIPEGQSSGTCESQLTLKFQGLNANSEDVSAVVRKVGENVAIVVDAQDDSSLSNDDVDTLVERFDSHIAPRMLQFFGDAQTNGRDRDGNGVVIAFFTSKVSTAGASVVGYFDARDMQTSAENPNSNGSDLLYLQPPGASISLDAISGTIGHEYQHLINYYAKVTRNQSEQEERWLDEGLACFAEDIVGYGNDTFTNVVAYLQNASDTSLTGYGLIHSNENEADSFERRGMAYLLIRQWYESHGAAEFPNGAGAATDRGGIAAVKALVQSEDTGIDVLTSSGQEWSSILGELLVSIALDGTPLECINNIGFQAPETDAYTQFQRGIDLRGTLTLPGGNTVQLSGPTSSSLESKDVPFPINGGEFHTVSTPAGSAQVTIGGPADLDIGMRVIATP